MASDTASQASTPSSLSVDRTWSFFRYAASNEIGFEKGRKIRYCLHCPLEKPFKTPFISNAKRHLEKQHPRQYILLQRSNEPPQIHIRNSSRQPSIEQFTVRSNEAILRQAFDQQRYREAIVALLTRRRIPFSAVEWSDMKELALSLNPVVEDLLLTSRRTAMRYIDATYRTYSIQLKEMLQCSRSLIHFSTDLWTSPSRRAHLAICVQWIDSSWKLQKALLGLPECPYDHSGEAQAHVIARMLEQYEISRIGYHVGDNATSNDTCLMALSQQLETDHGVS